LDRGQTPSHEGDAEDCYSCGLKDHKKDGHTLRQVCIFL
jgi:hypothetical protein